MGSLRRRDLEELLARLREHPERALAELALAMVLSLSRDLVGHHLAMRRREWRRKGTRLLKGRSVALIGLGRIGRRLAELLKPFEVTMYGVDPHADAAWCAAAAVR
jgi:D-3-phosphoglycerate dehydrogenase